MAAVGILEERIVGGGGIVEVGVAGAIGESCGANNAGEDGVAGITVEVGTPKQLGGGKSAIDKISRQGTKGGRRRATWFRRIRGLGSKL